MSDDRLDKTAKSTGQTHERVIPASIAIMITPRYAQAWYEDAIREAREGPTGDDQARRREIVCAVCCAESYLYEWAYDLLAKTHSYPDRDPVTRDLLPDRVEARSLTQLWVLTTRELHCAGFLRQLPDLKSSKHGKQWETLIEWRNGLVHAHVSRPDYGPGVDETPQVTESQLRKIGAGRAAGIVAERIRRLHEAAGTPPPDWLVDP